MTGGVQIRVHGVPAPQGSKGAFVDRAGKARMKESAGVRLWSWREAVRAEATRAMWEHRATHRSHLTLLLLGGPLEVREIYYQPRPKAHYRGGKVGRGLRPDAPTWVTTTPDLDKLQRATHDALTDSGLIGDDRQITRIVATHVYADPEPAGALITISRLTHGIPIPTDPP